MRIQPRLVGITFRQKARLFFSPVLVLQVVQQWDEYGLTYTQSFDARPEHLPILAAAGLLNLNAIPKEKS